MGDPRLKPPLKKQFPEVKAVSDVDNVIFGHDLDHTGGATGNLSQYDVYAGSTGGDPPLALGWQRLLPPFSAGDKNAPLPRMSAPFPAFSAGDKNAPLPKMAAPLLCRDSK